MMVGFVYFIQKENLFHNGDDVLCIMCVSSSSAGWLVVGMDVKKIFYDVQMLRRI